MYVVDRLDRIVVFKLDNAFDLSSGVTELGSINTNSYDPQTFSSEFNADGSKLYTLGYGNSINDNQGDDIDEFSVSPAYDIIPTLSSSTPADNATGISVTANIVLNFSENVDAESGNITIKKTSDNSTIETIDVTGAPVTSIVSIVELSDVFLIVILPLSASTFSLKFNTMFAVTLIPVALSAGVEDDKVGIIS